MPASTLGTWQKPRTRKKEKATDDVGGLRKEGYVKILRWREAAMDRVVWKERTDGHSDPAVVFGLTLNHVQQG